MSHPSHPDELEAQRRRLAVQLFREGHPPEEIAEQLQRSRRWVYRWVAYQHQHPPTGFRPVSHAAHHHPNQTSRWITRRIVPWRETLHYQGNPHLRYAPMGARTIQRELVKRRVRPCPSLSTIGRVLRRAGLTHPARADEPHRYRPHPVTEPPNDVQATDIVTRWLEGGSIVQAFTTVDHFSNAAHGTTHADKRVATARRHWLETWQTRGLPGIAQFDNESAFNGGPHPHQLSQIVRLCLYLGSQVLFIPEYEASYNWPIEAFNNFWAHPFWDKHHFTHRRRIRTPLQRFLRWYDSDYVAPRQHLEATEGVVSVVSARGICEQASARPAEGCVGRGPMQGILYRAPIRTGPCQRRGTGKRGTATIINDSLLAPVAASPVSNGRESLKMRKDGRVLLERTNGIERYSHWTFVSIGVRPA